TPSRLRPAQLVVNANIVPRDSDLAPVALERARASVRVVLIVRGVSDRRAQVRAGPQGARKGCRPGISGASVRGEQLRFVFPSEVNSPARRLRHRLENARKSAKPESDRKRSKSFFKAAIDRGPWVTACSRPPITRLFNSHGRVALLTRSRKGRSGQDPSPSPTQPQSHAETPAASRRMRRLPRWRGAESSNRRRGRRRCRST